MSLLTQASLIVTPNGEKEGRLYSVVPTNSSNGTFSVTRATTATRVNAAGLVELVPYNLLQYSEQFSQGVWGKTAATISANVTTAPNGTMTADKLVGTGNNPLTSQDSFTINGVTATISVFAKKAELNWLRLTNNGAAYSAAWFDLNTGTIGTISGSASPTATITNAGDGWYRCTITMLFNNTAIGDIVIACTNADNTTTGYTGNGTDGIFIWGAQLVEGTSALDYQATETRLNIPRLDYSLGSCPNILLEPQRTNLINYSEEFNNSTFWIRTGGVGVNANTSISPSGTLTADTITGATGTGGWGTSNVFQRSIPLASSTTYTFTIYLKGSGSVTVQLRDQTTGNLTALLCNLTSSWQRFELTRTTGAATTGLGIIFGSATGNFDIWGAQLEAGAYATSYIPTTSASVTRNADVISRGNVFTNGLITASGGTWFMDLRNNTAYTSDTNLGALYLDTNSTGYVNGFMFRKQTTGRTIIFKVISGGTSLLFTTTTDTCKIAIKWNGSTADVFQNGVKVVSATTFTTTNMQVLGNNTTPFRANINSMALFPTPLTDTQCIAITS